MRTFIAFGLVTASVLAVACTQPTSEGEEDLSPPIAVTSEALANNGGGYTTRDVCKACGCVATDVACNCGPRGPSPKTQECLDNGGPVKKVFTISEVGQVSGTMLQP